MASERWSGEASVRAAQPPDLPVLRELVERSSGTHADTGFRHNWNLLASALAEPGRLLLVYEEGEQLLAYALLSVADGWRLDLCEVDVGRRRQGIGSAFVAGLLAYLARTTPADYLVLRREPQHDYTFWLSRGWEPAGAGRAQVLCRDIPRPADGLAGLRQRLRGVQTCAVHLLFGSGAWTVPARAAPAAGAARCVPWARDRPYPQRTLAFPALRVAGRVYFPFKVVEQQRRAGGYTKLLCLVDGQAVFFGPVMAGRDVVAPGAAGLGVRPTGAASFWLWGLRLPGQAPPRPAEAGPPDLALERRWFQHVDLVALALAYARLDLGAARQPRQARSPRAGDGGGRDAVAWELVLRLEAASGEDQSPPLARGGGSEL